MTDPETRPSVGKDVGQDPLGDHPAPAPDSMRPSGNLVSSDKYNGKAVYGAEDKKVGSIESVMVDKSSGEPAYAVLSIGRNSRHGRRALPGALEAPEIQLQTRRLSQRHQREPAEGLSEERVRQFRLRALRLECETCGAQLLLRQRRYRNDEGGRGVSFDAKQRLTR